MAIKNLISIIRALWIIKLKAKGLVYRTRNQNIKYWENFSVKQLYLEYKILFAKEIKNKIKKNLENNSEFFSKINLIV